MEGAARCSNALLRLFISGAGCQRAGLSVRLLTVVPLHRLTLGMLALLNGSRSGSTAGPPRVPIRSERVMDTGFNDGDSDSAELTSPFSAIPLSTMSTSGADGCSLGCLN